MPKPMGKKQKPVKDDHAVDVYSDSLKISAIAQYDLSHQVRATARDFGIPHTTLLSWLKQRERDTLDISDYDYRIDHYKKILIDQSITLMGKALDQIDTKIADCNAVQAATVYGILHDKVAIMQGQVAGQGNTTNNLNIMVGSPEEAARLMQRTIDRMHGKGAETPQDVVIDVDSSVISDSGTEEETANAVIPTF